MLMFMRLLCLSLIVSSITAWQWDNVTQPIAIYRSRPDLLAPILMPLEGIHQPEKMAPGYFFVSPYSNVQPGIYIYDNNAELVYSSFGSYGAGPSHAPRVCIYDMEPHLCFYQGEQHVGWGHGHGVIMDKNYRFVRSVEPSCTYQSTSDMHEFYLINDGKRALMTQYVRSVYDMCAWGSCDGLGYIQSSGFQEVGVHDGECIFSWTSLDHVSPEDSLVPPGSTETSGSGESPDSPWDYFHINSIDKSDFDGSYLISARHMCAVYKIDGKTGKIIWQLGGRKNQYTYDNELGEIGFGFQHDARWIHDSEEESVISIFDNGSNGFTETARHSAGKIIYLDHRQKMARLFEKPLNPPFVDGHAHLAKSQGNLQVNIPGVDRVLDVDAQQLDSKPGNRILGYGNDAFFSEHAWVSDENVGGKWETVFYGALAWANMMNYRVLKFDNWVGIPLTKPALWSYSRFGAVHKENEMVLYVSWNGHTQIESFTFYGSNEDSAREGVDVSWQVLVADWAKSGFETIYKHAQTYRYVYVEAFSANSTCLGRSEVMRTFTPNGMMQKYCDDLACSWMDFEDDNREAARSRMKSEYKSWLTSHNEGTDSMRDGSSSSPKSTTGKTESIAKMVGILLSFTLLALVLIALTSRSVRRYAAKPWLRERAVGILGLQTRLREVLERGYYSKLDTSQADIEILDPDASDSLVLRSTENDLGFDKNRQSA